MSLVSELKREGRQEGAQKHAGDILSAAGYRGSTVPFGVSVTQTRATGMDCFELRDWLAMKLTEKQSQSRGRAPADGKFQGAVCAMVWVPEKMLRYWTKPLRTGTPLHAIGRVQTRFGKIRQPHNSRARFVRPNQTPRCDLQNFTTMPTKRCSVCGATFTKTPP